MDLIVNSTFNPFSMEDLYAPVRNATTMHQGYEDAYSALEEEAANIASKLNKDRDRDSYETYVNFYNNLQNSIDELSRKGLSPSTRRNLLLSKRNYSSSIKPIELAVEELAKRIKEQDNARQNDLTTVFERNARELSVDDLVKDMNLDPGRTYSGSKLAAQASAIFEAIKKATINRDSDFLNTSIPFKKKYITQKGMTFDDFQKFLSSPEGANEIYNDVINMVFGSVGMGSFKKDGTYNNDGWESEYDARNLYDYVKQSAVNSIGETNVEFVDDTYSKDVALESIRHRNAMIEKGDPVLYDDDESLFGTPIDLNAPEGDDYRYGYGKDDKISRKDLADLKKFTSYRTSSLKSVRGGTYTSGSSKLDATGHIQYYDGKKTRKYVQGKWVNPLAVKEAYREAFEKEKQKFISKLKKDATNGKGVIYDEEGAPIMITDSTADTLAKNSREVRKKALIRVSAKFGTAINHIVSDSQERYLRRRGFTSSMNEASFSHAREYAANNLEEIRVQGRHVNVDKSIGDPILSTISTTLNANNIQKGKIFTYDTRIPFGAIENSGEDATAEFRNLSGNMQITDVTLDPENPDFIILTASNRDNTGEKFSKTYAVSPTLLGGRVSKVMKEFKNRVMNRDEGYKYALNPEYADKVSALTLGLILGASPEVISRKKQELEEYNKQKK